MLQLCESLDSRYGATIAGVVIGTLLTQSIEWSKNRFRERKEKKDTALELFKEYSSPEFAKHRRTSYKLYEDSRYKNLIEKAKEKRPLQKEEGEDQTEGKTDQDEIIRDRIRLDNPEDSISLDIVMRMYIRIQVLLESQKVDGDLIFLLFSKNFKQFFENYFWGALDTKWESYGRLTYLYKWVEKNQRKPKPEPKKKDKTNDQPMIKTTRMEKYSHPFDSNK